MSEATFIDRAVKLTIKTAIKIVEISDNKELALIALKKWLEEQE